jgi:hypothetical protein
MSLFHTQKLLNVHFPTFRISHEDPGLSLNNLALFGNNGGLL